MSRSPSNPVVHARPRRRANAAIALALAACVSLAGAAAASARTVIDVPGDVGALAFTGPDLVVASQPAGRGMTVRRLRPGAPPAVLLRDRTVARDQRVTLAGSSQALAVGLAGSFFDRSRVLVGPAAGPLREVASCDDNGLPGPVSVFGSRVAWGDAGCSGATASMAIADADPAVAVRRLALPAVPGTIVLAQGDSGMVALVYDGPRGEVRPFGAGAIGAPFATAQQLIAAVGILGDGTRVVLGGEGGTPCDEVRVSTIAPGSTQRRAVDVGGPVAVGVCLGDAALGGTGNIPRVTADRIVALAVTSAAVGRRGETFSVVSVRADGSDRRVIARGDDTRAPGNIAVDGDRIAWQQPACFRGSEVVVDSIVSPSTYRVRHCRGEILTRSARVVDGRIAVRIRCPLGCNGSADAPRLVRSAPFAFAPGTGTLRLRVALGTRRSARVKLRLHVANASGVADTATISVRR